MPGASIYHFARGLAARDFFTTRDIARLRLAAGELPASAARSRRAHRRRPARPALAFVAGREVTEIVRLGEEIYDEPMADRIWPGTRALAQLHLDAGQRVWLVTATPGRARRDHRPPARADRRAGHGRRGSGRRLHRAAGRRAAARRGQGGGGPRAGRARGARPGPLLRLQRLDQRPADALRWSADPFAVNPDSALRDAGARPSGWEIRDFRTGRKAAKVGVPAALGTGAVAGGVAAGVKLLRRRAS